MQSTAGRYEYDVTSSWDTGFVTEWTFTPDAAVDGWQVTLRFDGDIVNVWNAEILSRTGDTVVLGDVGYNASLAAGQPTGFGFQASGTDTSVEVVGADGSEPVIPDVSVGDIAVGEGDPAADTPDDPADDGIVTLPLSTSGNAIVDADGDRVSLAGVSWFGGETTLGTPHGLWTRNWQDMIDQIADTGFNLIRLPFSSTAVTTDYQPSGIDFGANPDLEGLTTIEIIDKIVDYAAERDLMILLDNHRVTPGDGPSGRWTEGDFTEDDWVAMWEMLAARYADDPNVIGADLHNEPHLATWTEWSAAAERAGDAIHAIDDEWLIFVEGVGEYNGDNYWWGGNLKGVADDPVQLATPNKLVYSPHDYPPSVFDQPFFNDGSDLTDIFREHWGFIHEEEIAPVVIGEMGSRLEMEGDLRWFEEIRRYILGDNDGDGTLDPGADTDRPGFIWWSWNPNSGDTGGILQRDWRTVDQAKLDALAPLIDPAEPLGDPEGTPATFTVSLAAPLATAFALDYATRDGDAVAGSDYTATSGTLEFAPGETTKTVTVEVTPDEVAEGDETFFLDLSAPGVSATATATILDDDGDPAPEPEPAPVVSIADVSAAEGDGTASLALTLDRAADAPVTVEIATADGSAAAGEDYVAVDTAVTIPAGETSLPFTVDLVDDAAVEDDESFLVRLLSADGATIGGDGEATVTVADDDVAPPPPPSDPLAAEIAIVNDWGSGAQVGITITNESATMVNGWSLVFDAPFPITQFWGGTLSTADGEAAVSALDWNANLAPGDSAEVGFLTADGAFDMAAWAAATTVETTLA